VDRDNGGGEEGGKMKKKGYEFGEGREAEGAKVSIAVTGILGAWDVRLRSGEKGKEKVDPKKCFVGGRI